MQNTQKITAPTTQVLYRKPNTSQLPTVEKGQRIRLLNIKKKTTLFLNKQGSVLAWKASCHNHNE